MPAINMKYPEWVEPCPECGKELIAKRNNQEYKFVCEDCYWYGYLRLNSPVVIRHVREIENGNSTSTE